MKRGGARTAVALALLVPAVLAQPPAGATIVPTVASIEHGAGVAVAGKTDHLDAELLALAHGRPDRAGLTIRGDRVLVEVLHEPGASAAVLPERSVVAARVGAALTHAWVPIDAMSALAGRPGVLFVRPPLEAAVPDEGPVGHATTATGANGGQGITKTNADDWQAAGWNGSGLKIGIIDFFDGPSWDSAAVAGELPLSIGGTVCLDGGVACDIWDGGSDHGVAVAEVITDQAPGATVYLASASTTADLQAVVDHLADQGVRIITRSLTAHYDGAGNGTGPIATVIDSAVSKGIAWFNSAGNNAGATGAGGYYRGAWQDVDADGLMEFGPGDERLGFGCRFVNGLRWSDWSEAAGDIGATDYDVSVFEEAGDTVPIEVGQDPQGGGEPPLEHFGCSGADVDYLQVGLTSEGSGTAGDVIEFMANGGPVEYSQNPYSASGPAADTANPGAMAVGAVDPANGTTIASYSSRGPTNDERTKPDLVAASNVTNLTFGRFAGTSASAPLAAGAGALVLQAYPDMTPSDLMSWLRTSAVVERGTPGADNTYGAGELILPTPPSGAPPPKVNAPIAKTRVGVQIGTTIETAISWSGSAAAGIEHYELWVSAGGNPFVEQPLSVPTQTSVNVSLAPGSSYRYAVRARDQAGTWSAYRFGPAFTPVIRDDADPSIAYSAGWTLSPRTYAYGGMTERSSTAGATATVSFTGRAVAWVATRAPTSGRAQVYVDETLRTTVDLDRAATKGRLVVYAIRFATSAPHTLMIRGLATAGRPWVDLDALVVTL